MSHTIFASDDSNRRMNAGLRRVISFHCSSKLTAITNDSSHIFGSYTSLVGDKFSNIDRHVVIRRAGDLRIVWRVCFFTANWRTRDWCKEEREVIFFACRDRKVLCIARSSASMHSTHLECLANPGMSPLNSRLICIWYDLLGLIEFSRRREWLRLMYYVYRLCFVLFYSFTLAYL